MKADIPAFGEVNIIVYLVLFPLANSPYVFTGLSLTLCPQTTDPLTLVKRNVDTNPPLTYSVTPMDHCEPRTGAPPLMRLASCSAVIRFGSV